MAIFPFFKQREPRKWGYSPLYIDERKEKLERQIEKARRELDGDEGRTADDVKEALRGSITGQSKHLRKYANRSNATYKNRSQTNVLIIVAVLLLVVFITYYRNQIIAWIM